MIETQTNSDISPLEIMLGCGMTETSYIMKYLENANQFHNLTNSLRVVDVEHCPMGTSFLLYKDKLLRPNQKWTVGNKTKVNDFQDSQGQQEQPINDVTKKGMTMENPGMYGHHQFIAIEQQQMTYLKNQNRSQIFTHP